MSAILDLAHNLALAVAPELQAAPFYLVPSALAESAGLAMSDLRGVALVSSEFIWPLKEALGADYVGPGPIISLNLAAIEADARPGFLEPCALAVMLHEVAHVLPVREIADPIDNPETKALHVAALADACTRPDPGYGEPGDPHDLPFVRRVCHLVWRARAAGWDVRLSDALHSMGSFLAGGDRYAEALRGECEARRAATLAEIEAAPMPDELMTLWRQDCEFVDRCGRGATWA